MRSTGTVRLKYPLHRNVGGRMDTQRMIELCKQHTLFSWAARDAVAPMPISRAEGVYLYQPDGRRILDFNSQLEELPDS